MNLAEWIATVGATWLVVSCLTTPFAASALRRSRERLEAQQPPEADR